MSKGSKPRPIQVSDQEYTQRWNLIFGRDSFETKEVVTEQSDEQKQEDAVKTMAEFIL